jgi:hypothetical protein
MGGIPPRGHFFFFLGTKPEKKRAQKKRHDDKCDRSEWKFGSFGKGGNFGICDVLQRGFLGLPKILLRSFLIVRF